MNKKIILFIIGLVLVIAGLLGWHLLNGSQNLDEQDLKEVESVQGANEMLPVDEETSEVRKEASPLQNKTMQKPVVKKTSGKAKSDKKRFIINLSEPEVEVTPTFSEEVVQSRELEDVYVDSDGNVVVRREFRQPIREKVFFRDVVYRIKTRTVPAEKAE